MTWEAIAQGFVIAWGAVGVFWGFFRLCGALPSSTDESERESGEPVAWVDQRTPDDCYLACLASLTGIPLATFPQSPPRTPGDDAELGLEYANNIKEHLIKNGWCVVSTGQLAPKGYAIAIGASPRRKGVGHSIIVKDGEMVHDPNPDRTGIPKHEYYDIVVPLIHAQESDDD